MTAEARDAALELVRESLDAGGSWCGGRAGQLRAAASWSRRSCATCARYRPPGDFPLAVIPFDDEQDLLAMANDTEHGLAAFVFTSDLSTALRAAEGLQAGSVCINEPHFGIHLPHAGQKQSGVGMDRSCHSLEEYLTVKRVSIRK